MIRGVLGGEIFQILMRENLFAPEMVCIENGG